MKKIAIMVDGGYLRALSKKNGASYDPDFIEDFSKRCATQDEEILRILYYDCEPFSGKLKLPISGNETTYTASSVWMDDLACKELFAVRKGVLKFRGFVPKRVPIAATTLQDSDFKPNFMQKGVDMRIGIDVSVFAYEKSVDRIILISGDTDCIPAMKHARKAGLQVVLVQIESEGLSEELRHHADFVRQITVTKPATPQP